MPPRKQRSLRAGAPMSARWSPSPASAAGRRRRADRRADARALSRHGRGRIERHVAEACRRWPLLAVTVIHRYGRIAPGEDIVLVVTASSHREAAFAAAEFLMDYLKTRAPFWKQVERPSAQRPGWMRKPPTMRRPRSAGAGAGRKRPNDSRMATAGGQYGSDRRRGNCADRAGSARRRPRR